MLSRVGLFVGALLLVATVAAAVVVARSPELSAAWQRVNEVCSQPPVAADCLDVARTLNALRVRILLMAFSLVFGGTVSALGCVLIGAASDATQAAGGRQDLRRSSQTVPVVLVAIGGVAVIGGLFVTTYIR
jgi:hypothetical protein